jgi:hypothetical protein
MRQSWWLRGLTASVVLALVSAGCSRPTGVPTEPGVAQGDDAPFREPLPGTAKNEPNPSTAQTANNPGNARNLPFHEQDLPIGALVTVRLTGPIVADAPGDPRTFEAEVQEPVIVEGNTVIPKGAMAIGRVLSARTSEVKPTRGYIRLALDSVNVEGSEVSIRTASLFVKQTAVQNVSISRIGLEKGRRLTFRLIEPANVGSQRAHSRR